MQKSKIKKINLGKRLDFVGEFIPHVFSFSIGIFFSCGSRDEKNKKEGLTHFLEHMIFKGTHRRCARELFQKIESLGGFFDAYTTKENTIIITRFLKEYQSDVMEILLEILNEAALPEAEFEKERSVILEEVVSSNEDPGDRVFDLLINAAFKPHPISNPIVGYPETVKGLKRDDIIEHFRNLLSQQVTVAVAGNYNLDSLIQKLKDMKCKDRPLFKREIPVFNNEQITIEPKKDISQVHVALATQGPPYVDPKRYALNVISSAFGGGMSSRLFLRLRETEGMVYNVRTFNEFLSDIGLFGIYFVTDKKNLSKCLIAIREELVKLGEENFTDEELNIHRSLIKGNFLIGLESTTNRMLRLGRSFSQLKDIPEISEIISAVEDITPNKVFPLLRDLTDPAKYAIAIVGNASQEEAQAFFGS